ncbi:MAG: DUF547 domain-containing protein [Flavobacteriales bacterium]|nr:DUF547 domain-containing protein [Flavobacteriales bacterium]
MIKYKIKEYTLLIIALMAIIWGAQAQEKIVTLSTELVKKTFADDEFVSIQRDIANLDPDVLAEGLDNDIKRKSFWINIYNANIQSQLQVNPEKYNDRNAFFSTPSVAVAGNLLSFDQIEHDILRRGAPKWSMGYIRNPLPFGVIKKWRVDVVDERIHFALNCGAIDCPPVVAYTEQDFEEQIEQNTSSYLKVVTTFDENSTTATTTPLMSWFRGDFGGKSGIKSFLYERKIVPFWGSALNLDFKEYDWTLDLENYSVPLAQE